MYVGVCVFVRITKMLQFQGDPKCVTHIFTKPLTFLKVNLAYNTAVETGDVCPFEIVIKPKDKDPIQTESAVENEEPSARMEIEVCAR